MLLLRAMTKLRKIRGIFDVAITKNNIEETLAHLFNLDVMTKISTFNKSLIFVSTSSLINTGSFNPALENSINNLGKVAENNSVCL